jgi:hypothetical protein
MKATLLIENKDFIKKYSNEYGERLVLITPQYQGCAWDKMNLIFRSSIWTEDGYLVSPSFPKFFNWNEKDNLVPPPQSLINTTAVEKIDGSALIVTPYKGQLIIRTRGTFNADIFENFDEIKFFKKEFPKAFDFSDETCTRIFEWYSPKNKIVLDLGKTPRLFLVGIIRHEDYSLYTQASLDLIARQLGVERPASFTFESVEHLLEEVQRFDGKEGVCLYYDLDQHIKKIKGDKYLAVHAFKSDLSINNLLEAYTLYGRPKYQDFYNYIANTYDFECAEIAKGDISRLCDANKEVEKIVEHMKVFANDCKLLSRKEAALKITQAYGKTSRAGFVFTLLDGRQLDAEAYKKLLHQVIPK